MRRNMEEKGSVLIVDDNVDLCTTLSFILIARLIIPQSPRNGRIAALPTMRRKRQQGTTLEEITVHDER